MYIEQIHPSFLENPLNDNKKSIDVDGKVYFATEEEVTPGDIIKVKILDADEYDLTGQAEVI